MRECGIGSTRNGDVGQRFVIALALAKIANRIYDLFQLFTHWIYVTRVPSTSRLRAHKWQIAFVRNARYRIINAASSNPPPPPHPIPIPHPHHHHNASRLRRPSRRRPQVRLLHRPTPVNMPSPHTPRLHTQHQHPRNPDSSHLRP